jgi:hypothetical protein
VWLIFHKAGIRYHTHTNYPITSHVLHRPGEKRSRLVTSWFGDQARQLSRRSAVGAERVSNFAFVSAENRMNWLLQVGLTGRP